MKSEDKIICIENYYFLDKLTFEKGNKYLVNCVSNNWVFVDTYSDVTWVTSVVFDEKESGSNKNILSDFFVTKEEYRQIKIKKILE